MSKDAKFVRGQIRQIVKEIMPDIMEQALKADVYNSLKGELLTRLTMIETNVRQHLEKLDERQKDTLGYLIRQASAPDSMPSPEATSTVAAGEPKSE